ncbi:MAG: radical SAM protein [Alphaproteobacteria bacterium]|nr:radical SAM protein [Alphaproteobacteria bacterium]MCB9796552.1 radical SAM protein [Alphaproteobacteria bacterium]
MRISLVLPPSAQVNTPYPSTAYLARALRSRGLACEQRDLGIELLLRLLSREGLEQVFDQLEDSEELPEPAWRALALRRQHEAIIDPVVRFLQGRDRGLGPRLLQPGALPSGPRLAAADLSDFGRAGSDDAARHLATLYVFDLVDLVRATLDPGFGLTRYQHHLAVSPAPFAPLAERLAETTLLDAWLDALTDSLEADLVGLSVPFPGNLYGALRIGRRLKERGVTVLMGGGYVNTELREVDEPRLWEHVDGLCFDDGEGPLLAWIEHLQGGPDRRHRSLSAEGRHEAPAPALPMTSAADYAGLELDRYLQLIDTVNPAHRLWADGRWNKITLAHGCYWKRCAFCDISLDYIARFEDAGAAHLADQMQELIATTGRSGFHFVDEAAPPRAMKALAIELLARGVTATWWGNIRFERAFTPDLCRLLSAAGLVAVTGGLEVASDRLLALMEKGVTVEQVARAASAFQSAGVRVHAYLMYGFPTQTEQETLDSMELVRQLFAEGLLDSAFWHRFVLTRHSGVMADPARYGVEVLPRAPGAFADNDRAHRDPRGADHDRFDQALPRVLERWLRGKDLQRPLAHWFRSPVPAPTERPDRIRRALSAPTPEMGPRLLWLGGELLHGEDGLALFGPGGEALVQGPEDALDWLAEVLDAARPGEAPLLQRDAWEAFPGDRAAFEAAWRSAREVGLVGV